MLRNLNDLHGYALRATDGDVGTVKDFYFDDDRWVVRYLVVETGTWLSSRPVLISPVSLGVPDHDAKVVPVSITREQVKNSPDIDTDKPVSRQHEADYLGYYGYPVYWDSIGIWGAGGLPGTMLPGTVLAPSGVGVLEADRAVAAEVAARHRDDDPHLRACKSITGYHIKAQDGEIGHVQGFIVDEQSWQIRYLVVDTSNWWMGHKVLIAPDWISGVHWPDKTVSIDLTRASVKAAPVYEPVAGWSPALDSSLYQHYGRADYWSSAPYYPSAL